MNAAEAMEHSKDLLETLCIENISTLCKLNYDGKNIKLEISSRNSDYKETQYYCNETPYYCGEKKLLRYNEERLLHFTNMQSMHEILESNSLRMHSLNKCKDIYELEKFKTICNDDSFDFKMNYHILYATFVRQERYTDLEMWKNYGDKGNGVCIEFEIENIKEYWENFLLAPIQYQKDNKIFDLYDDAVKSFKKKHNYDISLDLSPIVPFFKSSELKDEQEVKMIFYKEPTVNNVEVTRLQNIINQEIVNYIPFPLSHISKHEQFKINDFETVPKLSISKIYTGFDATDKKYHLLNDLIADYKTYTLNEPDKKIEIEALGIQGKIR